MEFVNRSLFEHFWLVTTPRNSIEKRSEHRSKANTETTLQEPPQVDLEIALAKENDVQVQLKACVV